MRRRPLQLDKHSVDVVCVAHARNGDHALCRCGMCMAGGDVERYGFLGVLCSLKFGMQNAQWLWKQLRLLSPATTDGNSSCSIKGRYRSERRASAVAASTNRGCCGWAGSRQRRCRVSNQISMRHLVDEEDLFASHVAAPHQMLRLQVALEQEHVRDVVCDNMHRKAITINWLLCWIRCSMKAWP